MMDEGEWHKRRGAYGSVEREFDSAKSSRHVTNASESDMSTITNQSISNIVTGFIDCARELNEDKWELEELIRYAHSICDANAKNYQSWKQSVIEREKPFDVAIKSDYFSDLRKLLVLFGKLDVKVKEIQTATGSRVSCAEDVYRSQSLIQSILEDDWVPVVRTGELLDDVALSPANSNFLKALMAEKH